MESDQSWQAPGHHTPAPGDPARDRSGAGTPPGSTDATGGSWPAPPPAPQPGPAQGGDHGYGTFVAEPGIVPLRPLDLGALLGGAFKVLRFNPRATILFSLVVNLVGLAIILPLLVWTLSSLPDPDAADTAAGVPDLSSYANNLGQIPSAILTALAAIVLAVVVSRAVIGERTTVGEAWQHARPSLWRFIGLQLLVGVVAVVALGVVLGLAFVWWPGAILLGVVLVPLWILLAVRLAFSSTALVLERLRPVAALRRSWALTRHQFWRTLGISLVGQLLVGIVAGVLTFPAIAIAMAVVFATLAEGAGESSSTVMTVLVVTTAAATSIAAAVTTPVTSALTTLQYVDQRIRKEGFDIALTRAAAARRAEER